MSWDSWMWVIKFLLDDFIRLLYLDIVWIFVLKIFWKCFCWVSFLWLGIIGVGFCFVWFCCCFGGMGLGFLLRLGNILLRIVFWEVYFDWVRFGIWVGVIFWGGFCCWVWCWVRGWGIFFIICFLSFLSVIIVFVGGGFDNWIGVWKVVCVVLGVGIDVNFVLIFLRFLICLGVFICVWLDLRDGFIVVLWVRLWKRILMKMINLRMGLFFN